MTGQPAAAAICPECGLFICGQFWPDDQSPTAAENLARHVAEAHPATSDHLADIVAGAIVLWAGGDPERLNEALAWAGEERSTR